MLSIINSFNIGGINNNDAFENISESPNYALKCLSLQVITKDKNITYMSLIDKNISCKFILIVFLITEFLILILGHLEYIILLAPFIPIVIYAFHLVIRGENVKYRTFVLPFILATLLLLTSLYILIFYDPYQFVYWRRVVGFSTVLAFLVVFIKSFFIANLTDKNYILINGSLLIKQLNTLYFFYFGFLSILIYLDFVDKTPEVSALLLNPRPLMSVVVIFSMILKVQLLNKTKGKLSEMYTVDKPTSLQLENYKNKLETHFATSKIYLQNDLCIDEISEEINIPSNHIRYLFKYYLERDINHFIAEYRVGYAIELMWEKGDKYNLNAISHESGFRSRGTFNKYFKVFTGSLPSEYLIMTRKN